jgi:hypothetical protein
MEEGYDAVKPTNPGGGYADQENTHAARRSFKSVSRRYFTDDMAMPAATYARYAQTRRK